MWWEIGTYLATAVGAGASVCGIVEFFRRHQARKNRVTDEMDLVRAANHFVELHGVDASRRAAMRALALFDKGDMEGFDAWKRIARAVDELTTHDAFHTGDSHVLAKS
jgi:hypothetical protein